MAKVIKNIKIKLLIFINFFCFCANGQNGSITIENDFTMPVCKACTTLHATTTPVTGVGGTGSYTVVQNAYNPYPYVGTNILTVAGNFNGVLDDAWSNVIPLPFPFCFFNNTFNNCIIGQNGQVGFTTSLSNSYNNWLLSGVTLPNNNAFYNNTIMGALFDIYPYTFSAPATSNISTATYGTAPNRVFVVSFNSNPMFSCTSNFITQQIVLHEGTNVIDVNIESKLSCSSWNSDLAIEGIQNSLGTIAYTVPGRNGTAWTASNDSWSFIPQGGTGGTGVLPSSINWYTMSGTNLGTGDTMDVCPTVSQAYYAKATYDLCGSQLLVYDTVFITKNEPITFNINAITDVNCYNGSDGAIDFTVLGGSGNFSYTINGIASSNNPTNLTANTYTIIATDAYNCTGSTIINVNQPTDIVTTYLKNDVPCKYQNNGKVYLSTTGGMPPYQYWYNNTAKTSIDSFTTLLYGNYRFYTIDNHNCLDSIDLYISQPDSLLSIELIPKNVTCLSTNNGEVEAIPSGGVPPYSYLWNTWPTQLTNAILFNVSSGVYNGAVLDANGCIASDQVIVQQETCCNLFLPNAFTPNKDGKNDVFHITQKGAGIKLGDMKIFNRWGQEIFTSNNAETGWDGTYKGQPASADTYYYLVVYNCLDKGVSSQKIAKGDLILIR